jgi:hypothetical protein
VSRARSARHAYGLTITLALLKLPVGAVTGVFGLLLGNLDSSKREPSPPAGAEPTAGWPATT